jgi:hypothetical protein
MRNLLKAPGIVTALAFAAFGPAAAAQESTATFTCQDIGADAPLEPLGDREGHSISISQFSCRVDSGPMSGGVSTGTGIWEWNGPNAVLVSQHGVIRKAEATLVFVDTAGTLALTMAGDKVTGWAASGRVTFPVATGSAAAMAGKSATWTAKPTGPAQFSIDVSTK